MQKILDQLSGQEGRIQTLEVWRATEEAVRRERDRHMDDRFDRLEEGTREVKGYLTRVVWILITAIFLALINFITQGGLEILPNVP